MAARPCSSGDVGTKPLQQQLEQAATDCRTMAAAMQDVQQMTLQPGSRNNAPDELAITRELQDFARASA